MENELEGLKNYKDEVQEGDGWAKEEEGRL